MAINCKSDLSSLQYLIPKSKVFQQASTAYNRLAGFNMKTLFVVFISCFLLLFANPNHARKEPGEYWKSVMKDQPMPEAIKGLLHQDPASALDSEKKMKQFVKDFDMKHSLIIYHTSPESKEEDKPYVKALKDQKEHKSDKKH